MAILGADWKALEAHIGRLIARLEAGGEHDRANELRAHLERVRESQAAMPSPPPGGRVKPACNGCDGALGAISFGLELQHEAEPQEEPYRSLNMLHACSRSCLRLLVDGFAIGSPACPPEHAPPTPEELKQRHRRDAAREAKRIAEKLRKWREEDDDGEEPS